MNEYVIIVNFFCLLFTERDSRGGEWEFSVEKPSLHMEKVSLVKESGCVYWKHWINTEQNFAHIYLKIVWGTGTVIKVLKRGTLIGECVNHASVCQWRFFHKRGRRWLRARHPYCGTNVAVFSRIPPGMSRFHSSSTTFLF